MKFLKQLILILGISMIGEIFCFLLPIKIPSSIWGLAILILLLLTKAIVIEDIEETAHFFVTFMPVLFVPATFGLVEKWSQFKSLLPRLLIIIMLTTFVSMMISGKITDYFIDRRKSND